jgi:solute carrier family 35 protein E3
MNLSLKMNHLGFYQFSKVWTIPCVLLYKFVCLHEGTPAKTRLALAVLFIGLFLFGGPELHAGLVGSVIAAVAVVTTAAYQTLLWTMQRQYQVNGIQMSHAVGLRQSIICFLAGLLAETHGRQNICQQVYSANLLLRILVSGLLAAVGNVVAFVIIEDVGPVTFQFIGHAKTLLIFEIGTVLLGLGYESRSQMWKRLVGQLVLIVAVGLSLFWELFRVGEDGEPGTAGLVE